MSLKHFGLMSLYLRIHNHHKNHFREFPKSTLLILIWLSAGALLEKQPLRGMMAHTELGYVVSNRTHVDKVVRRVRELCTKRGPREQQVRRCISGFLLDLQASGRNPMSP